MGDSQSDIRAKIIAAAQKAIAELGVSNTILQVIADGAGISKGSLIILKPMIPSCIASWRKISHLQAYHATISGR